MKTGRKSAWDEKIKPRLAEIEGWCREGIYYQEMCNRLGCSLATFMKWKAEKSEFSEILKKGREVVDLQVENALLKAAQGYEYEEVIEEYFIDGKKIDPKDKKARPDKIHRKTIKKHQPANTTAQIFWLKNRQPEKWNDRKNIDLTGGVNITHDDWIKKLDEPK